MTKPRALSTRQIVEAEGARRVAAGQVNLDRLRPGVQAGARELLAQGDDVFFPPARDPGGRAVRPP